MKFRTHGILLQLSDKNTRMHKVSVYSTPTCVYCNAAKQFFKEKGVTFEEFNVATDLPKRQEMVEKSGQMGVPVIVVDEQIIVGFDQEKLTQLLGL